MGTYKYIAIIAALLASLFGAYRMGYTRAETEGRLAMEELKRAQAEAVIAAQEGVKRGYEEKIKLLSANLASVQSDHDKRLRELDTFRNASRDLATCLSERERLASVAVRFEELAGRAIGHLEAVAGP